MAASKKVIENSNRLRYVRAMQRFQKSIISYLSNTTALTKEGYDKKVQNALKVLHRVEEVQLYKGELKDLQEHVKKMIAYCESEESVDSIKEALLYAENQLQKSQNFKKYKKDKHSKSKFQDWE